ncbi:MAG TPA: phosphatase PAP2 family protein, partial [Kiritimatiellae bacterium]|nr:phosphatase PAP2 family protein [Kiritimatiellia bacterium]
MRIPMKRLRYGGVGFSDIAEDVRLTARTVRAGWVEARRMVLRLLVSGMVLGVAAGFLDSSAGRCMCRGGRPEAVRHLAREISSKAQPHRIPALLVAGCWLIGQVASRRRLRLLAVATLASMVMAGVTGNAVRALAGRPRPFVSAQRWHPFSLQTEFQSFPSAHTAVAFATAVPVVRCHPVLGGLLVVGATATGWSRMYQLAHHLSDVV